MVSGPGQNWGGKGWRGPGKQSQCSWGLLLSRWARPFLLCTGGKLVPAICSSFSSDFLSWNYRNDNKEPAHLTWQLAFLSLGKYLILSPFFFSQDPLVWAVFSISLLTLDKEEQIPSSTCIFAFSHFPTQTFPQPVAYRRKLHHLSPQLLGKCNFLGTRCCFLQELSTHSMSIGSVSTALLESVIP